MHLIGYMSESLIPADEIDDTVAEIVAEAQLRNITEGITGILFYHEGKFIQLVEGYQSSLRQLIDRISQDPRHNNLQFFLDEQVLHRTCPEWSMVSVNLDKTGDLNHLLIDHIHEIYQKKMQVEADGFSHTLRDFLAIPSVSVELFN